MLLECANCGAPLDVGSATRITKCRYCGVSSEAGRMRTIAAETPSDWRPPRDWKPPSHVPADSNVTLRYQGNNPVLAILIITATVIGIGSGIAASLGGRGRSGSMMSSGIDPKTLVKITLREPKGYFAKLPGASAWSDSGVRVPLSSDTWDAVTFEWDPAHPDHVLSFFLNCASPSPAYARVRGKLEQVLPRRFDGDSWQTEGAGIFYAQKGGVLSVHVDQEHFSSLSENQVWRQQAEALWDIVRAAALDLPVKPDPAAVRDYLGGGYPLTKVLELDSDATVEASDAAVRKIFRGAKRTKHIDLTYDVAVDHPWLGTAELSWGNKEGAQLKQVSLRGRNRGGKLEHQDDFIACTTTGLGVKPKVNVSDYLANDKDATFSPKEGGEVRIYTHMIMVTLRDSPFSRPMPKATFDKAVRVLDGCGRGGK